eukprot:scaffold95623_cov52-Attheya_sp.AAC.1
MASVGLNVEEWVVWVLVVMEEWGMAISGGPMGWRVGLVLVVVLIVILGGSRRSCCCLRSWLVGLGSRHAWCVPNGTGGLWASEQGGRAGSYVPLWAAAARRNALGVLYKVRFTLAT